MFLLLLVSPAGMILTLKDTGVPECVLSGPPQLVRRRLCTKMADMRAKVKPEHPAAARIRQIQMFFLISLVLISND